MKKLILIPLLFLALTSFAQVSKADFETLFSSFPQTAYEYVYVSNLNEYYTDGSSKYVQTKYYAEKMTMEAKDNAVYLKFYTDDTKSSMNDMMIIPYKNIEWIEGFEKGFIITLFK